MRINNFSVIIPEGRERESGYVELSHGQVYRLDLRNHDYRACDAEVLIDGKKVGEFRLNSNGGIMLERGVEDTGRFTFFAAGSDEGQQVGSASVSNEDRGLIQVRFKPEVHRRRYDSGVGVPRVMHMRSAGGMHSTGGGVNITELTSCSFAPPTPTMSRGVEAGVTGLTGASAQQFYHVVPLVCDPAGEVLISLRLVVSFMRLRPLQAVSQTANPVPAPVQ